MKAAIFLYADSPSLLIHAAQIDSMLKDSCIDISSTELWLFYNKKVINFPVMEYPVDKTAKVFIENPCLPESFLFLMEQIIDQFPVDIIIFPGTGQGEELSTRLAFRLDASSCLQVETCKTVSEKLEVTKPSYGNTLMATILLNKKPFCLSVSNTPCKPVKALPFEPDAMDLIKLEQLKQNWSNNLYLETDKQKLDSGLGDAKIILAVGQGLKTKEELEIIKDVADTLGARIGGSRPVVMNAWLGMDELIGISGQVLSPELCIAAGVSGSGAFRAGIQKSRFIVAINTDPHAPVFKIADAGIIDDQIAVLTQLAQLISNNGLSQD